MYDKHEDRLPDYESVTRNEVPQFLKDQVMHMLERGVNGERLLICISFNGQGKAWISQSTMYPATP